MKRLYKDDADECLKALAYIRRIAECRDPNPEGLEDDLKQAFTKVGYFLGAARRALPTKKVDLSSLNTKAGRSTRNGTSS